MTYEQVAVVVDVVVGIAGSERVGPVGVGPDAEALGGHPGEAVAREAISLLTDPARTSRMRAGLARVRARLGGSGASRRAADAILQTAGLAGS